MSTIVTDNMAFSDAVRVIASLDQNGAGDGGGPVSLTASQALHIKYRVLLTRAPDEQAITDMRQLDPASRIYNVAEALGSAEFHSDIYRHIDRLRDRPSSPVSWHFHLPRTAGSKFVADWRGRNGQVLRLPMDDSAQAGDWRAVARELHTLYNSFVTDTNTLLTGHVHFRAADRFIRGGDSLLTTVRHPVERAASLYRYAVAMCQNREIVNYPGDDRRRTHFCGDWRKTVGGAGLNPDDFSLPDFMSAGLCPDNQYAKFFAHTDDVRDIGKFMRHAGFRVAFQESLPDSEPLVNATSNQQFDHHDRRWLESLLRNDMRNYNSIVDEYSGDN